MSTVVKRSGLTAKRRLGNALVILDQQSVKFGGALHNLFAQLSVQVITTNALIDSDGTWDLDLVEAYVRAALTTLNELVMASDGEVRCVLDNSLRLELLAVRGLIMLCHAQSGTAGESVRRCLAPIAESGKGPWS